MNKILVIDKNRAMREFLRERLEHEGYCVDVLEYCNFTTPNIPSFAYNVIICDDQTINDAVKYSQPERSDMAIIVMSNSNQAALIFNSSPAVIYSIVPRQPFDLTKLRDTIVELNQRLSSSVSLQVKSHIGRVVRNRGYKPSQEIIGHSKEINYIRWIIDRVAPISARVLIEGANGTGKELVAHQLHTNSLRYDQPFIEVNCAAIPSELIESELFGHEKGSFTSAIKSRKGKFEQADGGTLFLDEIGDMSLSAQSKVLRALQENRISRVGSDKDVSVDVRIIAATNKNLEDEIRKGCFREDLYHRLSVVVINVPSLNERIDDIPILAEYFMERISQEYAMPIKLIEPNAIKALCDRIWSGNIRELRNVIERLVIFSNETVTEQDVVRYTRNNH